MLVLYGAGQRCASRAAGKRTWRAHSWDGITLPQASHLRPEPVCSGTALALPQSSVGGREYLSMCLESKDAERAAGAGGERSCWCLFRMSVISQARQTLAHTPTWRGQAWAPLGRSGQWAAVPHGTWMRARRGGGVGLERLRAWVLSWNPENPAARRQVAGGKHVHRDSYGRFAADARAGDNTSLGWNDYMLLDEFLVRPPACDRSGV